MKSDKVELDDKFICPGPTLTLPKIQQRVDDFLLRTPISGNANLAEIEKAMLVLFPCPFSPNTKEDYGTDLYRPVVKGDIEGSWIYPETSQKFRFGPKSPNWSRTASAPIKCECITYNPDGFVLHGESGATVCPFSSAKEVENIFRAFPHVESWQLTNNGKVKISRTDVPNHIEEWEIFVVVRPHARYGVSFDVGDLVAYLRRNEGNELYAVTLFRHLKRLP